MYKLVSLSYNVNSRNVFETSTIFQTEIDGVFLLGALHLQSFSDRRQLY